jgi:hypothetical protein
MLQKCRHLPSIVETMSPNGGGYLCTHEDSILKLRASIRVLGYQKRYMVLVTAANHYCDIAIMIPPSCGVTKK